MVLHKIYTETVNRTKQEFSKGELSLMVEVSRDRYLDPATVPVTLFNAITDYLDETPYEERWGITNRAEFVNRLENLTEWQAACLQIWARDFWETGASSIDNYVKAGPSIMFDLETMKKALAVSIELQIQHKRAVKSPTAAQAREQTERAKEILDKIIG